MFTLTCGAAMVSCQSDRGTTLAHVGGLVVPSSAAEVVRSIEAVSEVSGSSGQVVVYSAQVLIAPDRLFKAAQSSGRDKLPTAVVVRPDQIELFRAYAKLAMAAGVLKAAFLSEQQAREWVDQAVLVEAYRRSRAGRHQSERADLQKAYPF
jgi:hypothetical protein